MLAPFPEVQDLVSPKAARAVSPDVLATLFTEARTAHAFLSDPVPTDLLSQLAELSHLGPTAFNANPMRVVFVQTADAKERLLPALSPGNVEKTKAAPVMAIIAHDLGFVDTLPRLFPQMDLSSLGKDANAAARTALYNAALQTGYFILAARALGLDAGPMGGFDKAKVDAEFFPEGTLKSDLLVNLGYGDDAQLRPRNPRLPLDEIARFV